MAGKIRVNKLGGEKGGSLLSQEDWEDFKERFQISVACVKIGAEEATEPGDKAVLVDHRKGCMLLDCIGEEGFKIFKTWGIKVDDIRYSDLLQRFDTHFGGVGYSVMSMHRFFYAWTSYSNNF